MKPEFREIKLLVTGVLAGGWIMMTIQPAPSWSAIWSGLLCLVVAGGLHLVARCEAWMRRKTRRHVQAAEPSGPPQPVKVPRLGALQQDQLSAPDRRKQPQQRWHRSGGRMRRVSAAPGFEPVAS